MSKNIKILIAIGGTGGHVFPGCNLAYHLAEQNYNIKLVTDRRGYKFCKNFKDLNITVLPSSPLMTKNIFKFIRFTFSDF